MTVVLLLIPLVLMVGLYGCVIKSLRTGIKMDIASIEVGGEFLQRNYLFFVYRQIFTYRKYLDGNSEGSRVERPVPFKSDASIKNRTLSSRSKRTTRQVLINSKEVSQ